MKFPSDGLGLLVPTVGPPKNPVMGVPAGFLAGNRRRTAALRHSDE